jgi:hypothetical protein
MGDLLGLPHAGATPQGIAAALIRFVWIRSSGERYDDLSELMRGVVRQPGQGYSSSSSASSKYQR